MWKLALALLTTFSLPTAASDPWEDSYGPNPEAGSFFMDRCYAFMMNGAVENDQWIEALSVYKTCKCLKGADKSEAQRCQNMVKWK